MMMKVDMTAAKIGRSMKKLESFTVSPQWILRDYLWHSTHCAAVALSSRPSGLAACAGDCSPIVDPRRRTSDPGRTRCRPSTTIVSPLRQPVAYHAQPIDHRAQFDRPVLGLLVGADDEHVFAILIGADSTIVDKHCFMWVRCPAASRVRTYLA